MSKSDFHGLRAVYLNASLKRLPGDSHTRRLMARSAGIMRAEGVEVEMIHALEHNIPFGMVKDASKDSGLKDDWPAIHAKIMSADIFVLGSPI